VTLQLGLVVFAAGLVMKAQTPNLLRDALKTLPGVRVPVKPADEDAAADLKAGGFWPPIKVLDLDGDGFDDIAAVVTRRSQFGVLAVHSRSPGQVHWVLPLGARQITGLATPPYWHGSLQPLLCFYCDTDPVLRWSGTQYEYDLWRRSEKLQLPERTIFRAGPSSKAPIVYRPADYTCDATVLEIAGTPEHRWYLIEARTPRLKRGWVSGNFTAFWWVGHSGCP
jgi:hypothetical protein